MERSINTSEAAAHTPQDEVFSRTCMFFEEFPREIWLPAIWTILKGYTNPKYETREDMLHDEDVQIFVHMVALLDDLEPTCAKALQNETYHAVPDISPSNPAA